MTRREGRERWGVVGARWPQALEGRRRVLRVWDADPEVLGCVSPSLGVSGLSPGGGVKGEPAVRSAPRGHGSRVCSSWCRSRPDPASQEEKKRKREKEHGDTEGEAEDFDPGKKVEVEPPPDRPVRACRTQAGECGAGAVSRASAYRLRLAPCRGAGAGLRPRPLGRSRGGGDAGSSA